jgi:hypothetical protein
MYHSDATKKDEIICAGAFRKFAESQVHKLAWILPPHISVLSLICWIRIPNVYY